MIQYGSLNKREILMKQTRTDRKLQFLEGRVIAKEGGNGTTILLIEA